MNAYKINLSNDKPKIVFTSNSSPRTTQLWTKT